jgi:hypothetical protein
LAVQFLLNLVYIKYEENPPEGDLE